MDGDFIMSVIRGAILAAGGVPKRPVARAPRVSDEDDVDQAGLLAPSPELLTEVVKHLVPDGSREWWIACGMAIKGAGGTLDQWAEVSDRWDGPAEDVEDLSRRWEGFKNLRIGWGWLEREARAQGWIGSAVRDFAGLDLQAIAADAKAKGSAGHNGGPPLDDEPVAFSEDAVAAEFTRLHSGGWRYVAGWGTWLRWDGTRWCQDATLEAQDLVRAVCRRAACQADGATLRARLSKAATVAAVERLAQADRRHALSTDGWDADPWLLNTPAGVVDLRSGELSEHDPELRMTKITAAAPAALPTCPTWLRFLHEATGGDAETVEFLRHWCGYCLTGSTREHALLFVFGPGGNGKSVFVNTLAGIMGDYAMTAGMETFAAARGDRHSTEIARLRGARLVTASETEEGRAWAEARIKVMTGGDPVTARFMRQDEFTFTPEFKLTISGNHRPRITNVDAAAQRRINIAPFTQRPEVPDPDLQAKLKEEWPGILRWMTNGCLEWQQSGLKRSQAVLSETAEYFSSEDPIGRWLEECCEPDPQAKEKSVALHGSYMIWAQTNREQDRGPTWFGSALTNRGFERWRDKTGRGYRGIRLVINSDPQTWP